MRQVRVEWDQLELAFENASVAASYFLDAETGQVEMINEEFMLREEVEQAREKIDADDSGRFIQIPHVESHEGYEEMLDFTGTVPSDRVRDLLERALRGRGAFRRFKDTLAEFPEERERWFKFRDERLRERIKEWLEEEGIEPV